MATLSSGDLHGRFLAMLFPPMSPLRAPGCYLLRFICRRQPTSSGPYFDGRQKIRPISGRGVERNNGDYRISGSQTPASGRWEDRRGSWLCRAQSSKLSCFRMQLRPKNFLGILAERPRNAPRQPFVETWFRPERLPWAREHCGDKGLFALPSNIHSCKS